MLIAATAAVNTAENSRFGFPVAFILPPEITLWPPKTFGEVVVPPAARGDAVAPI